MIVRLAVILCALVCLFEGAAFCSPASKSQVRHELRQILSQPEYSQISEKNKSWDLKPLQRFFEWLGKTLKPRLRGGHPDQILTFIFAWIVVIGFIALLSIVIRRMASLSVFRERTQDGDGPSSSKMLSQGPLLREAARLAESGDYRNAFRCAYLASIAHLDEAGILRYERGRTNWEYLRRLSDSKLYGQFADLTKDFDRVIYGRAQCEATDYSRALSFYDALSRQEVAA